MLKIAVIGGKLQGTEACYLARKAGFKTLLIEKKKGTPASGICDEEAIFDVCLKEWELIEKLLDVDFIIPALENQAVHKSLKEIADENNIKMAFDMDAYSISSSKIKSDILMRDNGLPLPIYYPDCDPPFVLKPSDESGSSGVCVINTVDELKKDMLNKKDWIAQEFLEGPSYSIEVIGVPGNYRTYKITKIHMDEVYDCNRVTSPCEINNEQAESFHEIGSKIAELIKLHGIMDVEVIDHKGVFKILEIDARIPSQTPTVVYHASGVNLLEELADIVMYGEFRKENKELNRLCSYEHYEINGRTVKTHGEHMMGEVGPLIYREGFMDCHETLSDYESGKTSWRGTFINSADTEIELEEKRKKMLENIQKLAEYEMDKKIKGE